MMLNTKHQTTNSNHEQHQLEEFLVPSLFNFVILNRLKIQLNNKYPKYVSLRKAEQ